MRAGVIAEVDSLIASATFAHPDPQRPQAAAGTWS